MKSSNAKLMNAVSRIRLLLKAEGSFANSTNVTSRGASEGEPKLNRSGAHWVSPENEMPATARALAIFDAPERKTLPKIALADAPRDSLLKASIEKPLIFFCPPTPRGDRRISPDNDQVSAGPLLFGGVGCSAC